MTQAAHPSARRLVLKRLVDGIRPGPRKVYIADNSRLWPDLDSDKHRSEVEALCQPRGLEPVWPSEHYLVSDLIPDHAEAARLLPRAPLRNISGVAALIADISPFRGPSLNPVIALEIGVAIALELPVFAWTEAFDADSKFTSLVRKLALRYGITVEPNKVCYDSAFNKVENFGLPESAAIAGNLASLSKSRDEAIQACAKHFTGAGIAPSPKS
jgi:nucleoside 2-deoxyribosyltransferase